MTELFIGIAMDIILTTFGIFGWFKFSEEKRRYDKLSAENMRLTMENYNLNNRLHKVIPISHKDRSEE